MQEKSTSFSIKNWSQDDQPREKLLYKGKAILSDAELVAILIGSGNREESAVDLSKRILASVGNNLSELGKLSIKQLMTFKGIGEAKAITIAAALELGRRRRGEDALQKKKITSSASVFELMQPIIGELQHEEFWIIYLNNSNKVIHKNQLSKGGITGTLVDVRLVLKQALEVGAIGLILAHNHPSGTLKPSEADKQITNKLKLASESLDIKVLDHLIVTEKNYFSFADENIL
ncbi:RadC family protein [Yeosuana marina]|uniref:RadC family protein n=1 Tax=Yeosuana marina TaxID=1565536 RepID=UPI0030EE8825|tara:strand:+ start:2834 stop:3532 length:699 start_codon:yes stop_codon:yes gene_type:complete